LILCIPPPNAGVHISVDSTALWLSEMHQIKIEVCLRRKMC
jgi:hypothetical protein